MSDSPHSSPTSPRGVNRGPRKLTAKEIVAERARIDAAMEVIDAAKAKAKAQRAEYGKYLSWKVDMQRKERAAREEEEKNMRDRIDAKLRTILADHREQKKKEITQWNQFAAAKVKKRAPLRLAMALDSEEALLAARTAQRQEMNERNQAMFRSALARSAPTRSNPHKRAAMQASATTLDAAGAGQSTTMSAGAGDKSSVMHSPVKPGGGPGGLSPRKPPPPLSQQERLLMESKERGQLDMVALGMIMDLPELVTTETLAGNMYSPEEQSRQRQARMQNAKSHRRMEKVEDMYHKARTRRLYATNRLLADPPADYILDTNVLRYIPADVLERVTNDGPSAVKRTGMLEPLGYEPLPPPTTDKNSFFMTATHHVNPDAPYHTMENEPHASASGVPTDGMLLNDPQGINASPHPPQQSRLGQPGGGKFDPLSWRHANARRSVQLQQQQQGASSVPVVAPPNREEEQATLEWYYQNCEPYSRVKKRTEHHGSNYVWKKIDKHVLPKTRASLKFRSELPSEI